MVVGDCVGVYFLEAAGSFGEKKGLKKDSSDKLSHSYYIISKTSPFVLFGEVAFHIEAFKKTQCFRKMVKDEFKMRVNGEFIFWDCVGKIGVRLSSKRIWKVRGLKQTYDFVSVGIDDY